MFRTLFPYLRRHRWRLFLGALVVGGTSFLAARIPPLVGAVVDYILGGSVAPGRLALSLGLIVGLAVVAAGLHYLQRILIIITSRKIEYELRNDFFGHLLKLPPSFYDRMKTGDIISRATSDIDQIRTVLGPGIMYPIAALTLAPFTLYFMLRISWPAALVGFAPMLVMPFLVNILANLTYKRSLSIQEHFADFSGRIQESISGVHVVKSFTQEGHEEEVLDGYNRRNADLNM
ncbi:hypothetical protein HQ520_12560, partial [bacterium]|nr:hypothetical protein [bacterium]